MMANEQYHYSDLTGKVIGCAMEVPRTLGNGVQVEDVHLAQAINYLEAYGLEVGPLLNFGARSLQFKHVMKLVRV
jgi:hypothetical protein